MSFQIGGRQFPIDPRDFIQQSYPDSLATCKAKIETTDPPSSYLHSWSLGVPFLKSSVPGCHFLSFRIADYPTGRWWYSTLEIWYIHHETLLALASCLQCLKMRLLCLSKL